MKKAEQVEEEVIEETKLGGPEVDLIAAEIREVEEAEKPQEEAAERVEEVAEEVEFERKTELEEISEFYVEEFIPSQMGEPITIPEEVIEEETAKGTILGSFPSHLLSHLNLHECSILRIFFHSWSLISKV